MQLQEVIEKAWADRELLKSIETQEAIREVVSLLDQGKLRVAEQVGEVWKVNEWIKKESLSTTETTHKSKKMIFNYVIEFFRKENIIYVNEIKLFDITDIM